MVGQKVSGVLKEYYVVICILALRQLRFFVFKKRFKVGHYANTQIFPTTWFRSEEYKLQVEE